MARRAVKAALEALRLDLGCGPHPKEGFTGVDSRKFPGVDIVHNLLKPWPWMALKWTNTSSPASWVMKP